MPVLSYLGRPLKIPRCVDELLASQQPMPVKLPPVPAAERYQSDQAASQRAVRRAEPRSVPIDLFEERHFECC